jgi:hypothetical protein
LKKIAHVLQFILLFQVAGIFPSTSWSRPAGPISSSKQVSMQEYVTALRTATSALEGESSNSVKDFRESLPGEWVVQSDGQSFRVKTDWLAVALLAVEKGPKENANLVKQAQEHLAALRETAEGLVGPPAGADLGQAHAQVDHILSGREFKGSHEPTWFDKLNARVRAWIARHLESLFGRMGVSASVGNAIAWTLVSLVGLLLVFWAVRYVIAAANRSQMDLSGIPPAGRDWRYWAGEARASAQRGDFRSAIHAAYWCAVTQLEENRLLPGDPSRTPRESLRLLKKENAVYGPLSQLTRRFELTWYGYKAATSLDWDDAVKQLEALDCLRLSTRAIANS